MGHATDPELHNCQLIETTILVMCLSSVELSLRYFEITSATCSEHLVNWCDRIASFWLDLVRLVGFCRWIQRLAGLCLFVLGSCLLWEKAYNSRLVMCVHLAAVYSACELNFFQWL